MILPSIRPAIVVLAAVGWRRPGRGRYPESMEQREEPVTMTEATDEERAQARAEFRRKLAEAEARMTPEKRDQIRAAFGLDTRAA